MNKCSKDGGSILGHGRVNRDTVRQETDHGQEHSLEECSRGKSSRMSTKKNNLALPGSISAFQGVKAAHYIS